MDQREKFEAHIRSECDSKEYADSILEKNKGGFYHVTRIQGAWEGWQAALAASAPVVAMTDDEIYNFWLHRDCMPAIQAGDIRGQFISAARALLTSAGVEVKP